MKPSWQVMKLIEWRGKRPGGFVQVGAAAQPRRQRAGHARLAAPEAAHVVAVAAVPFRPAPAERETADLIQARRVPRLGDQLGVGQHAVLGDHLDDRRLHQHVAHASRGP